MKIRVLIVLILLMVITACDNSAEKETLLKESKNVTEEQEEEKVTEVKKVVTVETVEEPEDYIILEKLVFEQIRDHNTVGDNGERTHKVFLPPSYYDGEKSYPVVYYFHGFASRITEFDSTMATVLKRMENGKMPEFIAVVVGYGTNHGGSFMENSEITGHWEEAFRHELIAYIDKQYRTLRKKESRGLLGFSMGGYSVLKLGFNNPDLVNTFFAYGPGLLLDEDFEMALGMWDNNFETAYSSAFADSMKDEVPSLIPTLDGSDVDQKLVDLWMSGFGNLEEKIADYRLKDTQLAGFGLEVGENDSYPWIFNGTKSFHELLDEQGIDHLYNQTAGGHAILSYSVTDIALPYMLEHMELE